MSDTPTSLRVHGTFTLTSEVIDSTFHLFDEFHGDLTGKGEAVNASDNATSDPDVGGASTSLVIHDPRGDISGLAQSVFSKVKTQEDAFAFLYNITSGTGDFAGATGYLIAFGYTPPGHKLGEAKYEGLIILGA